MIIRIEIHFNMARHVTPGLTSLLMIFILVMQGNVSRIIPEDSIINNDFECHIDSDCVENKTFCDNNLHLCSQCLNCNVYFRTSKKNINCPKDISDCGTCLDGYSEEIFFGGEIRDTCVAIDSDILPTPAKIISTFDWQDVGIFLVAINMFLIVLLWTYFYKKIVNLNNMSNVIQESDEYQPPSYNSCMKLENYVTDDVQEFHLFTGEQPPRNEWRHQNAVPFRLPNDSLETINYTNQNENTEEVDRSVMREIENPELHDEETMPSTWTPPPVPPPSPPPPLPLPSLPQPLLPLSEVIHFPNENSQINPPPHKRIRLEHKSSDGKNYQDEDNGSDMSQDEL